jgi:hypothetical protein
MSKLGAPLTPYALAELTELYHTLDRKRCRIIKKNLLDSRDIETPEAWSTAYAEAINKEARTLVLKQNYIVNDLKPTAKGLRSSLLRQSTVTKVNLSIDQFKKLITFNPGQDAVGVYDVVHTLGLMDLTKEQVTFHVKLSGAESAKLSTNVIHVKRDPKSTHTKSINFEIVETRVFECVQDPSIHVFISTNSDTHSAYVKVEFIPTCGPDRGKTWVNECVLIFNQTSKITFNTLIDYGVKQNRAMSERIAANSLNGAGREYVDSMIFSVRGEDLTTKQLGDFFEKKLNVYKHIARDPSRLLMHDHYIKCLKTVVHEHRKLHFTYAYLRGMAAMLLREICNYQRLACTFDCVVNYIQNSVDTAVERSKPRVDGYLIPSLIQIMRMVDVFMNKLVDMKKAAGTEIDIKAAASNVYRWTLQWLQQSKINTADIWAHPNQHFGSILAIYIFESTNPKDSPMRQTIAWLKDDTKETVSGTEWTASFDAKFHINKLLDPRKIFDGVEFLPWIDTYNLFKEEKNGNDLLYKHMFRVKYTAKQKLRLSALHPYTDLYEVTITG